MRIVHLLEVVKIDEQYAELIAETRGTVNFRLERLVKMARVVQARAVVGDRQFLNLFDGARVLDRDGSVVAQGLQEENFLVAESLHVDVDQLNHAQHAVLGVQRDADDGARFPLCDFIDALGETSVGVNVGYDQLLAVFRNPAGNAFADFQANVFECLGGIAHGDSEIELVVLLVDHQQRPGFRMEVFRHLFHDRLQDGIEIQRRSQGLSDIVKDVELLTLPSSVGSSGLGHVQILLAVRKNCLKLYASPERASNDLK